MRRLFFVLLLASLSTAAAVQGSRPAVKVAPAEGNLSLWLPGETTPLGEVVAQDLASRFLALWRETFGGAPTLPDPLEVPRSSDLKEGLFESLWRASAQALPPDEEPAARAAFRARLLGDPTALLEALARASEETRLLDLPEPLLYLFLWDWAADRTFLPEALPPGPERTRVRKALGRRGVSYEFFRQKAVAWFFGRAAEGGFLSAAPSGLPAVWLLDRDLAPGTFQAWTFSTDETAAAVALSAAGSPGSLHIFLLERDGNGRLLQEGRGTPASASFPLSPESRTVTLLLWNAGSEPSGGGLTLTLWKSSSPPFVVREAERSPKALELLLEEGPGVLDYRLVSAGGDSASLPAFPSEGAGLHRYRLALGDAPQELSGFRLLCRTRMGGRYEAALPESEDRRP